MKISNLHERMAGAKMTILCKCIIFGLMAMVLSGCVLAPKTPDLGVLYTKSASYPKPQRNPVIVIPGLLGSRLKDTDSGTVVWGAFSGNFANPTTSKGARLVALPMKKGVPLKDLKDSIMPNGALGRIDLSVVFLPVRLNAYYNILRILGIAGYRDEDLSKSDSIKYEKGHFYFISI